MIQKYQQKKDLLQVGYKYIDYLKVVAERNKTKKIKKKNKECFFKIENAKLTFFDRSNLLNSI